MRENNTLNTQTNNSTNIRSFEAYEKMIRQSKSKSKIINDENDFPKILTPSDNQSNRSSSPNMKGLVSINTVNNVNNNLALTNNNDIKKKKSPTTIELLKNTNPNKQSSAKQQKQASTKQLSPNRHKNHNHSPIKTVPYSQIQLILESIEQIKSKAKQQIQQWQEKNNQLVEQNDKMKREIIRVRQLEVVINNDRKEMGINQNQLKQSMQKKHNETAIKERMWLQEKQQYIQEMLNVKESHRILQQEIQQLRNQHQQLIVRNNQQNERYLSLINVITFNNPQRLAELIYQLQNKYFDKAVLDIFQQQQKQMMLMQKQCEQCHQENLTIKQNLQQQKNQLFKQQQLTNKLMEQNKRLIETISLKEQLFSQQKKSLSKKIQQANCNNEEIKLTLESELNKVSSQQCLVIKQNQGVIDRLQGEVSELENRLKNVIAESQQTIQELKVTVCQLQQTIQNKELIIEDKVKQIEDLNEDKNQIKKNYEYFEIVDEQCEELNDLSKIVQKLQIIEKVKLQNQLNIQKIQFLSKMLDC